MIPITAAALGTDNIKKSVEKLQATNASNASSGIKPIENKPVQNNSNLESRVSALESMMGSGYKMEMGSKQIATPTNFASRDLEKLYSAATLGAGKIFM